MGQLLIYQQPVVLNRARHRTLRIRPRVTDYTFAARINSVPLMANEFAAAARHYPIVFAGPSAEQMMPVALLGLEGERNLFVEADGQWATDTYVPAFIRRYPFVTATRAEGESDFDVCVDQAYIDDGDDAVRLFDDEGKETPVLTEAMRFLSDYQGQVDGTRQFMDQLLKHDLLIEKTLTVNREGREPSYLRGFSVIDETRVQGLVARALRELSKAGSLGLCYVHLMSLGNVQPLLQRLERLQSHNNYN